MNEAELFALEYIAYLPLVYWMKLWQAHLEFMEDM
jgi:hypothetical protein